MAAPRYNQQIVGQGLAWLTPGFRSQPAIRAWLAVLMQPWQDLEDATWVLLGARFLATATVLTPPAQNEVFDVIGALVGEPRSGLSDVEYRAVIYLRIAVNRAIGAIRDWSNIGAILLRTAGGPVSYYDDEAGIYFGVWGFPSDPASAQIPNVVADTIEDAVPNGVRGTFAYSTWSDGNDFEFGSTYDATAGQGTFGSTYDASVGGLLVAGAEI